MQLMSEDNPTPPFPSMENPTNKPTSEPTTGTRNKTAANDAWLLDMIPEGGKQGAEFDRPTTQAGRHCAILDLDGLCLTLASATHDLIGETRKGDVQDAWMGLFQAQSIVRAIELLRKIEMQGNQLANDLERLDRADTCQAASRLRNILNPNHNAR